MICPILSPLVGQRDRLREQQLGVGGGALGRGRRDGGLADDRRHRDRAVALEGRERRWRAASRRRRRPGRPRPARRRRCRRPGRPAWRCAASARASRASSAASASSGRPAPARRSRTTCTAAGGPRRGRRGTPGRRWRSASSRMPSSDGTTSAVVSPTRTVTGADSRSPRSWTMRARASVRLRPPRSTPDDRRARHDVAARGERVDAQRRGQEDSGHQRRKAYAATSAECLPPRCTGDPVIGRVLARRHQVPARVGGRTTGYEIPVPAGYD